MNFDILLQRLRRVEREIQDLRTHEDFSVTLSEDNVSNPPTDAQLDSAFGTVFDGFVGLVYDGAGTTVWLCVYLASAWWTVELTEAL